VVGKSEAITGIVTGHCVLPAGGLSADRTRWIRPCYAFFLPVQVLSRVFRGKFHEALKRAFHDGRLNFHGDLKLLAQPKVFAAWLRPLFRKDWVVYCPRPPQSRAASFKSLYRRRASTPPSCAPLASSRFRYNTRTSGPTLLQILSVTQSKIQRRHELDLGGLRAPAEIHDSANT
jgi:hypothetical protein